MYAVVEFDRDEDGPCNRTYLFNNKEEAIEFEKDFYGSARTYELVPLGSDDYNPKNPRNEISENKLYIAPNTHSIMKKELGV